MTVSLQRFCLAAMMTAPLLLSAALLLLLPGTLSQTSKSVSFELVVENSIDNTQTRTFTASGVPGGILLAAMTRLMNSNTNFEFTYSEDQNYGPYLESVNGVAGNDKDRTYWQLLKEAQDGTVTELDVGIGCYIPSTDEKIILKFTKY